MIGRWWRRLLGDTPTPEGFDGRLDADELVLGSAPLGSGHLVATTLGLWIPEEGTHRRIGWHLVSKATWDGRALTVIEADEVGTVPLHDASSGSSAGQAVLIVDRQARRFPLSEPGTLPQLVHARVTRSVLHSQHRERPDGGHLLVTRRVPGHDGVQLQVRRDKP